MDLHAGTCRVFSDSGLARCGIVVTAPLSICCIHSACVVDDLANVVG